MRERYLTADRKTALSETIDSKLTDINLISLKNLGRKLKETTYSTSHEVLRLHIVKQ